MRCSRQHNIQEEEMKGKQIGGGGGEKEVYVENSRRFYTCTHKIISARFFVDIKNFILKFMGQQHHQSGEIGVVCPQSTNFDTHP